MNKNDIKIFRVFFIIFSFLAIAPFLGLPISWGNFLFLFFLYGVSADMFNFLAGYSGILPLGLHGFIGLGSYSMAILVTKLGFPVLFSLLLSGVISAILASAVCFLIWRMKGVFFAMGTLVTASLLKYWFQSWSYVGGGYGIAISGYVPHQNLYYLALALFAFSNLITYFLLKSSVGLKLKALGDNDVVAESYGVNVFLIKLYAWVVSAFMIGLVGGIYSLYSNYITPSSVFSFDWTLIAISATIIGGKRSINGPIIGTFIIAILRHFLLVEFPGLSALVYGLLMVMILSILPEGIAGFVRNFLAKFATRISGH